MAVKDVDPAPTQPLGRPDEACPNCGAPMAADQRYCLQCGTRRGESRVPEAYLAPTAGAANGSAAVTTETAPSRAADPSPLGAVLGIALLGGMLLIGVLLGRGEDETVTTTTVTEPQGAAVAPPAAGGTAADESGEPAAEPLVSEWPAGTDGWTVQLQTLPKADSGAADVSAAKEDLAAAGVPDASVLDSDLYPSLTAGNWVLYSGVYDSKGDAAEALEGLVASAPGAEVVEVSQSGGGDKSAPETSSDDADNAPAQRTEDVPSANGGGVAPAAETPAAEAGGAMPEDDGR